MYAAVEETIGRSGREPAAVFYGNTATGRAAGKPARKPVRDGSVNTVRIAGIASNLAGRTTTQTGSGIATRTTAGALSGNAADTATDNATSTAARIPTRTPAP